MTGITLPVSTPPARDPRPRRPPPGIDRLTAWLIGAVLVLWPLVLIAFWPRYLSQVQHADGYRHAHALLGGAWLSLLLVQPLLLRRGRMATHRGVGRAGVLVGAGFVVTGVLSAHRMLAGMDAERYARDGFFLYLVLATTVLFGAALWLGFAWRRSPAVHGRFMACTLLPLLDPVFTRLLGFHLPRLPFDALYQMPALLLTAGALAWLWRTLPRQAPGRTAFAAFALAAMSLLLLYFGTEHNRTWLRFVDWFRALPLT